MELSDRLQELRKRQGKSLRQVQKDTGISNAHLSQLEKGKIKKPSRELLKRLSLYYREDITTSSPRAGTYEPISIIQSDDIIDLANRKEAEGMLPKIVRDLIVSTTEYESLSMPHGSSIHRPGWDGQIFRKDGFENQFVPKGASFWEIGKNQDFKKKATSDIEKRTKNTKAAIIKSSIFVFVTPRRWPTKEGWAREMRDKYPGWKNIKVIDADDIELWLEKSPGVALKLAQTLGRFPLRGAVTIQNFWEEWYHSTVPSIEEELLLEAGQGCLHSLEAFLKDQGSNHYKLKSTAHEISLAYLYAVINQLKNNLLRDSLLSRTIVLYEKNSFRELSQRNTRLLLIPLFDGAPIGLAMKNGHQVIITTKDIEEGEKQFIDRVSHRSLISYLTRKKLSEDKAKRYASQSHGYLSVLRVILGNEGEIGRPEWCTSSIGVELAPFILFGSWSSSNSFDKNFIKEVSGKKYEDVERLLQKFLVMKSPPLKKIGEVYTFYQEFSFGFLAEVMVTSDIEKFIEYSSKLLLCQYNSKYDLKKEDRFMAAIYEKGLPSSSFLRKGVATSFALLANYSIQNKYEISIFLASAIRRILKNNKSWKYWASLSDILMLLAEASPREFLTQLQGACEDEEFFEIFNQTTSMGVCEYAAILWSLELCGWEKNHLREVTEILLKMSGRENKASNYANQPSNTLQNIYRIQMPQTSCEFDGRMEILEELRPQYPSQILHLLLEMIPRSHKVLHLNYKSKYRDIQQSEEIVSHEDMYKFTKSICIKIKKILEEQPHFWPEVFDNIINIYAINLVTGFFETLNSVDKSFLSEDVKFKLWEKISHAYSVHLKFKKSDWSLKGRQLMLMKKLYERFTPQNSIKKWKNVFAPAWDVDHPSLYETGDSYDAQVDGTKEIRKIALGEIINQFGNDKIIKLIKIVPNSGILGETYAEVLDDEIKRRELIFTFDYSESAEQLEFYSAFIEVSYRNRKLSWLAEMIKNSILDNDRISEIYLSLPSSKKVWDIVEKSPHEVQGLYWNKISWAIDFKNSKELQWVGRKLLDHGRPFMAFSVIFALS